MGWGLVLEKGAASMAGAVLSPNMHEPYARRASGTVLRADTAAAAGGAPAGA